MGELRGIMRAKRRLSPKEDDNFALNDVTAGSASMDSLFATINLGGWFIAILSLIVGGFGVANIMFVTVRERTPIIGLKKAIGAKQSTILFEFLLESAFLCIIGGLIGLLLVLPVTLVLSNVMKFNIYLSWGNFALSIILCIVLGILSGIIPASVAAKMDPVNAIRSK
jgi:putative ABC transport system permease protein